MPSGASAAGAHRPRLIICAGLKSSASTWLYNAIILILRAHRPVGGRRKSRVAAFYAEDPASFPQSAGRADFVVVKTHIPSAALLALARDAGTLFVTVREPRDAIASLMQRFHHAFEVALRDVAAGSRRMAALKRMKPFVLRYERRFYDDEATVAQVAAHLGLAVPASTLRAIHRSLTRDKVKAKIAALARRGTFGRRRHPDSFDPKTHWHPGHVGDATSGKHRLVLGAAQARAVLAATRQYRAAFGYRRAGSAAAKFLPKPRRS